MMLPDPAPSIDTSEQPDEAIVQRVLDGDTGLFELLMRRHNERVYRAARAVVHDEQEAEDVMQQAYVNAFTHLQQFKGSARFSTWLIRIAVNEALSRIRRRHRFAAYDDDLPNGASATPAAESPEHQLHTSELRSLLESAIDGLPDGAREVFMLREVEGLSTSDVADCLGLSEDAVKTRLSRGRAALRRLLLGRVGASTADAFRFYRPRCDRIVANVLARITTAGVRAQNDVNE